MQRSYVILAMLVALVAACTSGPSDPAPDESSTTPPAASPSEPTAPAGRIAVVLDPRLPGQAEPTRQAIEELGSEATDDRPVRVEIAADGSFVEDLAEFLAVEGFGLVCVLGPSAEDVVRDLAPRSPSTRFCAAPAQGGESVPDNVLPIDVRIEELAYLAGIALGTDLEAGPVAAVTAEGADRDRLRSGLRAGLLEVGLRPASVRFAAPVDEEDAVERTRSLLADGVRGVLDLAGGRGGSVVEVATSERLPVPTSSPSPTEGTEPPEEPGQEFAGLVLGGPLAPSEDPLPEQVLTVLDVRLERALVLALQRHVGDWDPSPATVGVADDAIVVVPNEQARSPAVGSAVEDAVEAVRRGDVAPGGPTVEPSPS